MAQPGEHRHVAGCHGSGSALAQRRNKGVDAVAGMTGNQQCFTALDLVDIVSLEQIRLVEDNDAFIVD